MSVTEAALRGRPLARVALRRVAALSLLAVALVALYRFWLRDSSLVAVQTVHVEGVGASSQGKLLREALTSAAEDMTTLHVRTGLLEEAAQPFPLVESVRADPSFPTTLTVHVIRRRPAGVIGSGSAAVPVAADGTILRGLPVGRLDLPRLPLSAPPRGDRLEGPVLDQAVILGAAPAALRRFVEDSFNGSSGLGVTLDGGIELRFGDAVRAADKWRAAAAVLSDPDLGPLDYVDLNVPGRPAVGGTGHSPPPID